MFDSPLIGKVKYSCTYGSVALKSLQNENIPDIDLLVREAIQNSSDASLSIEGKRSFTVAFNHNEFNTNELNSLITDLSDELTARFNEPTSEYLEVRDIDTEGLTGPTSLHDLNPNDHGNYFKLIFDTGKNQTTPGAGGNWGFGKSVYYRIGIGIVFFYSQIKTESGYQSRLIGTMIEDETGDNGKVPLLRSLEENSIGRAWWGKQDPNNEEEVRPITDDSEITQFLNVFGIEKFRPRETGTSVIIPYISGEQLLSPVLPSGSSDGNEDELRRRALWSRDLDAYIELSIQRWYAPKIQNIYLADQAGYKFLRAFVNGKPLRADDMPILFQLVQTLYNQAFSRNLQKDCPEDPRWNIQIKPVRINLLLDSPIAGHVAIATVDEEAFGVPSINPYILTRNFEHLSNGNEPIVMFARELGMVISYCTSGQWVKNIMPSKENSSYTICFFVPNTQRVLSDKCGQLEGTPLSEYLRSCEASDHADWQDKASINLIARIKTNTAMIINKTVVPEEPAPPTASASRLRGVLGHKLLPTPGYADSRNGSSGGHGGGGSFGGGKSVEFKVTEYSFVDGGIQVGYELSLVASKSPKTIQVEVISESGDINGTAWQYEIGSSFPVSAIGMLATATNLQGASFNLACDANHPEASCDLCSMTIKPTEARIIVKPKDPHLTIRGGIALTASDRKYQFGIKVV